MEEGILGKRTMAEIAGELTFDDIASDLGLASIDQIPLPLLLAASPYQQKIYAGLIDGVQTIEGESRYLSSCRKLQILYFFYIVRSRNNEDFEIELKTACTNKESVLDYVPLIMPLKRLQDNPTIKKIFDLNKAREHNIIQVTSLAQIIDETNRFFPHSSVDFGMCKIFPLVMYYDGTRIASHYFTLICIIDGDGNIKMMYLYNSYGSENMQQPPFLRRIDIYDFDEIIQIIGKLPIYRTSRDYRRMDYLFTKYFLGSSGLGVSPNDDQIDDGGLHPFKKIKQEEGRDMELEFLKGARSSSFGFITSIISQVSEAEIKPQKSRVATLNIASQGPEEELGGGKPKTRKTRKTKRRKTRRRKTRRRKTRRRKTKKTKRRKTRK